MLNKKGDIMKKSNVVEFSELVDYATEKHGYEQSDACDLLDNFRPQYEVKKIELELDDLDDPDLYGEEEANIVKCFLKEKNMEEIIIVN